MRPLMMLLLLQQPLSMAREFDLVKTWNNYITNSSILKVWCCAVL